MSCLKFHIAPSPYACTGFLFKSTYSESGSRHDQVLFVAVLCFKLS